MNLNKLFDYSVPLVAAATILVVGVVVSALYAGKVVSDIKLANDTVEVTGSAKAGVRRAFVRILPARTRPVSMHAETREPSLKPP